MRTRRRFLARLLALVLVIGAAAVVIKSEAEAARLTTNPSVGRKVPKKTPATDGVSFIDAGVTTAEGLKLVGWYMPGTNGVTVIFVHGYKNDRGSMLGAAEMFHAHGYGALVIALRAHDRSDGERITFGHLEVGDLEALMCNANRAAQDNEQQT